jgi:hypothetical protein
MPCPEVEWLVDKHVSWEDLRAVVNGQRNQCRMYEDNTRQSCTG